MGLAQSFSTPPPPSLNEAVEGLRTAHAGRKGLRPLPSADANLLNTAAKGLAALPAVYPTPIFITNK